MEMKEMMETVPRQDSDCATYLHVGYNLNGRSTTSNNRNLLLLPLLLRVFLRPLSGMDDLPLEILQAFNSGPRNLVEDSRGMEQNVAHLRG